MLMGSSPSKNRNAISWANPSSTLRGRGLACEKLGCNLIHACNASLYVSTGFDDKYKTSEERCFVRSKAQDTIKELNDRMFRRIHPVEDLTMSQDACRQIRRQAAQAQYGRHTKALTTAATARAYWSYPLGEAHPSRHGA